MLLRLLRQSKWGWKEGRGDLGGGGGGGDGKIEGWLKG